MADLASKQYIFDLNKLFKKTFNNMIHNGLFASDDVEFLAFCYTAPITMLIGLYDRDNTCEAYVTDQIERHIDAFIKELKVNHEIIK